MGANEILGYGVRLLPPVVGTCSCFGGPLDRGVGQDEGLALFDYVTAQGSYGTGLFNTPIRVDRGLARQLNPSAFYCAMRWNYGVTPTFNLRRGIVMVTSEAGVVVFVKPVDWGPNIDTKRVIDLSPAAIVALKVGTDDVVTCELILPS